MKKTYKNVSRSKTLITCSLKDGKSMYIPYGSVMTIDDSQLTDYLKRRIATRDLKDVSNSLPSPSFKKAESKAAKETEKKK